MVLSSTIIIVPKVIEYGQEMPQSQTAVQLGMAPLWYHHRMVYLHSALSS